MAAITIDAREAAEICSGRSWDIVTTEKLPTDVRYMAIIERGDRHRVVAVVEFGGDTRPKQSELADEWTTTDQWKPKRRWSIKRRWPMLESVVVEPGAGLRWLPDEESARVRRCAAFQASKAPWA